MRKILAHNLAHDECTNVTRDPKREHKQLIYNILHKSLNRNFGKYIQFCIEEVVYMCAMRLKARGIYGTYSGTRVPNSEKYVPNENCILLKHKIFPNSVFLYWKIQVILHRKVTRDQQQLQNITIDYKGVDYQRLFFLLYDYIGLIQSFFSSFLYLICTAMIFSE